ncbi:MAG TPA: hypothetical protein VKJ07_12370, partial [Mycobacteriales bacterium]|nr:hypothetical protein [Mycobacteriales bacterium]
YTMMTAGTVALAWLPDHGGQNHEDTDINAYRENNLHAHGDDSNHRNTPQPPRPEVGRVRPVRSGRNFRRQS